MAVQIDKLKELLRAVAGTGHELAEDRRKPPQPTVLKAAQSAAVKEAVVTVRELLADMTATERVLTEVMAIAAEFNIDLQL